MNVALIGYGAMGHELERLCAGRRDISVKAVFDGANNRAGAGLTAKSLKGIDVCIDFSTPHAVVANISSAAACGKNIVIGTTGWYADLPRAKRIANKRRIGLLYSPNFSLGMNVFFRIVDAASRQFAKYAAYDVAVHEIHHRGKSDSPSGTALAIGRIILDRVRTKKKIFSESSHRKIGAAQLHITSSRVGNVAGTHRVLFDSASDAVELAHIAKDRSGFALGALLAAKWLKGKKGIFTMDDVVI